MNWPIPAFVPVPSGEVMQTISIVSLLVGISMVSVGLLFLLLNRKKEKKAAASWICLGVGGLLIVNHSIQLLF